MIRNKTIKFDMDKDDDRKLWEYLSQLPHGVFTESVKDYFRDRMYESSYLIDSSSDKSTGNGLRFNDPTVDDAFKELSKSLKETFDEEIPPDSPFHKLFK